MLKEKSKFNEPFVAEDGTLFDAAVGAAALDAAAGGEGTEDADAACPKRLHQQRYEVGGAADHDCPGTTYGCLFCQFFRALLQFGAVGQLLDRQRLANGVALRLGKLAEIVLHLRRSQRVLGHVVDVHNRIMGDAARGEKVFFLIRR